MGRVGEGKEWDQSQTVFVVSVFIHFVTVQPTIQGYNVTYTHTAYKYNNNKKYDI